MLLELYKALIAAPTLTINELNIAFRAEGDGSPMVFHWSFSDVIFLPSLKKLFISKFVLIPETAIRTRILANLRQLQFVNVEAWRSVDEMLRMFVTMPRLEVYSHTHLGQSLPQMMLDLLQELPIPATVHLDRRLATPRLHHFCCLAFSPSAAVTIRDDSFQSHNGTVYETSRVVRHGFAEPFLHGHREAHSLRRRAP